MIKLTVFLLRKNEKQEKQTHVLLILTMNLVTTHLCWPWGKHNCYHIALKKGAIHRFVTNHLNF